MSNLSLSLSGRTLAPLAVPATPTSAPKGLFGRAKRSETADTLAGIRVGGEGTVRGFDETVDGPTMRRLFDLGFKPGARVELLRRAPLADPLIFRVADTEIALRRRQARAIHILPVR